MNKTALKIRIYGDPSLRKHTKPIKLITESHQEVLSKMAQLMYAESGIGLAASQVGINESLIVVDIGTGLYKLVNPVITARHGSHEMEEGCLSVPGVCLKIKRSAKISVKAQDEFSKPVNIDAEGLLACVLQHEIDHLNGKLIVDYASLLDKLKIKKKLRELKKMAEYERMSQSETKSCKLQL